MKNKKAAMEMSVGTIVTIVLLMSVLVLGIFLIKNIFSSSKNAVDLTDQQLQSELQKLFSDEETASVIIYPTNKLIELKHEEEGAVGLGIKNLGTSVNAPTEFDYEVIPGENDCGLTDKDLYEWISLGAVNANPITIPIGDVYSTKIRFNVPLGTPICLARFDVNVYLGGKPYGASTFFDIKVKAK